MITLRRLHAENFKGLRAVDLTFPERGSILIEGHNEAGKSTLFEAVYVALYGEPLVGEDSRPRLEEVIQHGQPSASVELAFTVGVQELVVHRVIRRAQTQRARLTIRQPDGREETVDRPTAVNKRILRELNNLDGDNLRNSCFVEQKELGRLEEMDSSKREQAIQKLLGLERLTKLADQFKFKREQERELNHASRLLDLARAQADTRAAAAKERELAERRDAAEIAAHLAEHLALEREQAAIKGQLKARAEDESQARDRLARAGRIREQLAACDAAQQRMGKALAQREAIERLEEQCAELDVIERETRPAALTRQVKIRTALDLVIVAERERAAAQSAVAAERDAQRSVAELERAEDVVRQRAETVDTARMRADQHRQETQAAGERHQQHLADLATCHALLSQAGESVTTWEQARERQEAIGRVLRAAEEQTHTVADLRTALQRREEAASRAEQAAAHAERERQEAQARRLQVEGRTALREWIRLKEVETSLSGYAHDRARLEDERNRAANLHAAARRRSRGPLYAALAVTLLAGLALAIGAVWIPALAFGGILAVAAILLWIAYGRARAAVGPRAVAFEAAQDRLRDLTLRYQAAVHAGGDPALLGQRERELIAAGFTAPASLDAARSLLAGFPPEDALDYQRVRAAADGAMAAAARQTSEAERAREEVARARAALRAADAQDNAEALLRELRAREMSQRETVEAAEGAAREAASRCLPPLLWPASSAQVQVALASCAAERRAVEQAITDLAATATAAAQDRADALAQAEQALRLAQDAAAALRAGEPRAKLADAQADLARTDTVARTAEARAREAVRGCGLAENRAAVEAERGRVEERLHALADRIATRPALLAELAEAQAARTSMLQDARTALRAIVEAARPLVTSVGVVAPFPAGGAWDSDDPDDHQLAAGLDRVRAALEAARAKLDEAGAKDALETILHAKGTLTQSLRAAQDRLATTEDAMRDIVTRRRLPTPPRYASVELVAVWPLVGMVTAADKERIGVELEQARKQLFADQDRSRRLMEELKHPGTPLDIEDCHRRVRDLEEQKAICQRASLMIQEARERIARQVLPTTERNMQLLLPELTAQRYWDVRLTPPEGEDGQRAQLDYRIRVWDQAAGRYVAKNLFSGGTRDQCSLALRLAFALATLPRELGVAPGFIFLDEPLSAFDAQRAQALVELLTTGTIARQFAQVVVISHHHAFDRRAFQYHIRMEGGQAAESDLPDTREQAPRASARLATRGGVVAQLSV